MEIAENAVNKIKELKCDSDIKGDSKSKQICKLLHENVNTLIMDKAALNAGNAEGYIDRLGNIESSLLQPAQALVVWRFSQGFTAAGEKSFKDIYTPKPPSDLKGCGSTKPTDSEYMQCKNDDSYDDGLDNYVNNLVGLNAVIPPLQY